MADLHFARSRRSSHRLGIRMHRDKVGRCSRFTGKTREDGKARIAQADDLDGGNGGKRGGKSLVAADRDHSPGIIRPILLRSRSKTEISSSASCAACA